MYDVIIWLSLLTFLKVLIPFSKNRIIVMIDFKIISLSSLLPRIECHRLETLLRLGILLLLLLLLLPLTEILLTLLLRRGL